MAVGEQEEASFSGRHHEPSKLPPEEVRTPVPQALRLRGRTSWCLTAPVPCAGTCARHI